LLKPGLIFVAHRAPIPKNNVSTSFISLMPSLKFGES